MYFKYRDKIKDILTPLRELAKLEMERSQICTHESRKIKRNMFLHNHIARLRAQTPLLNNFFSLFLRDMGNRLYICIS
jgi:hypothetical protein